VEESDIRTKDSPHCPVGGGHRQFQPPMVAFLKGDAQLLFQYPQIHCVLQMEVIGVRRIKAGLWPAGVSTVQNGGQVHRGRPLVDGGLPYPQQVGAAYQLVHRAHPKPGHMLP